MPRPAVPGSRFPGRSRFAQGYSPRRFPVPSPSAAPETGARPGPGGRRRPGRPAPFGRRRRPARRRCSEDRGAAPPGPGGGPDATGPVSGPRFFGPGRSARSAVLRRPRGPFPAPPRVSLPAPVVAPGISPGSPRPFFPAPWPIPAGSEFVLPGRPWRSISGRRGNA